MTIVQYQNLYYIVSLIFTETNNDKSEQKFVNHFCTSWFYRKKSLFLQKKHSNLFILFKNILRTDNKVEVLYHDLLAHITKFKRQQNYFLMDLHCIFDMDFPHNNWI